MFITDVKKVTNDEVAGQRSNLYKKTRKFTNMEKLIHELLESINPVTEMEVDGILSTWHNVRKLKDSAMLPR